MQLARDAAARALAARTEPEPAAAEPPPAAVPETVTKTARAPSTTLRAASCKHVDPALLFIRLVAAARDCMVLEARLLAGTVASARPAPARHADPRRALVLDGFRHITKNHPDRIDLMRQATADLDEDLAADPEQQIDIPELFWTIADALGIEVDLATLPDPFVGLGPDTPDPCATSPP
jgi:hypothetical protein